MGPNRTRECACSIVTLSNPTAFIKTLVGHDDGAQDDARYEPLAEALLLAAAAVCYSFGLSNVAVAAIVLGHAHISKTDSNTGT